MGSDLLSGVGKVLRDVANHQQGMKGVHEQGIFFPAVLLGGFNLLLAFGYSLLIFPLPLCTGILGGAGFVSAPRVVNI